MLGVTPDSVPVDSSGSHSNGLQRLRTWLFLVMVLVLPLHTVFLRAWIAWKPFLILLAAVLALDLLATVRARAWPWHAPASAALAVFLATLLVGIPAAEHREGFLRLWLALGVGGAVMLVTERGLRTPEALRRMLKVQFLSAAAMAVTGVLFTLLAVGVFGERALSRVNELPGVYRVTRTAYLEEGFVALTNWHHEAGYGASWATVWAVLVLVASTRGQASGRWRVDAAVIGGLAFAVVAAFSRTAWLVLPAALLSTVLLLAWRRWARPGELVRLLLVASLVALILLAAVWMTDPPHVGGDLGVQFAFRWHQGCDLLGAFGHWWASDVDLVSSFDPSEKRPEVWAWYLDAFLDNPLAGTGLGVGQATIGFEPHNLVVELLGESGVLGLVAFLLVLGVVVRHGRNLAGAAALLAAFMPLMTLTVLFEPAWWFAAGLLLAGGRVGPNPGGHATSTPPPTAPTTPP